MTAVSNPRVVECDFSTTADAGATCSSFTNSWGLSVDSLKQLNPGITCPNLDTSKSYCVISIATEELSSTTSTTLKQPPLCLPPVIPHNARGYKQLRRIPPGCGTIAAKYGISEANFKGWNTQVDASMLFFRF
ncbi:hypothetical protein N7451_004251 [Penicillium sp. IBT 35674x]|nr:hypothetical protein N7451_004251 [Penicillium sp. IBT 35674x]